MTSHLDPEVWSKYFKHLEPDKLKSMHFYRHYVNSYYSDIESLSAIHRVQALGSSHLPPKMKDIHRTIVKKIQQEHLTWILSGKPK